LDSVELNEAFQLVDEFFQHKVRLCFLPRPNAPTGVCAPREEVQRLCAEFDGIVVIDEAYVDFADDHCMDFAKRYENAIVMRTFSKSFSLAGLRLGLGVANPAIIGEFLKTKDSYNLNVVTQTVGLAALEDYEWMKRNAARVRETRENASAALSELGFAVTPSQSNFLLARRNGTPDARAIFERLKEKKIFVRYFDAPRLRDALRITVGTDAEMRALLEALREIVQ
jgi:histidinol-phosphate aminotransferase